MLIITMSDVLGLGFLGLIEVGLVVVRVATWLEYHLDKRRGR